LSFVIDVFKEDPREALIQVDAARAQRALHKYAHYQHIDKYYEVTEFNVDFHTQKGHILVREVEYPEYTTSADIDCTIQIKQTQTQRVAHRYNVSFGRVISCTNVSGYYKVPLFARNEPFVFQPLGKAVPPPLEYETQALWITFFESVLYDHSTEEQLAGLYSLAGALRLATAVEELCDPVDIEALGQILHTDTQLPTIILYDSTPGGVGIAEAAYAKTEQILRRALTILEDCPHCSKHPESRGCPYCVTARYGDASSINRSLAIQIGRTLLG
jgi:DEAD/DEAH box helicase domain-containing protein